jgi:hypothetical protein
VEVSLPGQITAHQGPKDVALVRAWPDGRTDKGWGLNPPPDSNEGFMPRYMRGEFNPRRVLYGYDKGKWNFAIVMRSVRLVCIDIDGKNGGLDHAKRLGALPMTTAETSKSGDGFHLFYTVDEEWDLVKGFGLFGDRIGIEQGVDFRATGCVYHYPQQRWNHRLPVELPDHLKELLNQREQKLAAVNARITSVLASGDDMEVLMLHDEIMTKLARPIPEGKRNQTLFAIGSEMQAAGIPNWEQALSDRALDLGLDQDEVNKLGNNIKRYAQATP